MMNHLRIALYDMKSGTAEEAAEVARNGLLPIFKEQPGFVRYEVGKLDDGGVVSFSVWETADEAQAAVDTAASWVAENLAERISLRENHVGDLFWDVDST
jgi:heme-degrading monooxygenase HmoA